MNHDEWLAQNSIDCAPLGARISLAQCKTNLGHTFACESCPHGGVKYVGPAKVTKPNRNQQPPASDEQPAIVPVIAIKEKTMTKLAKGTCPTCKRTEVTLTQTKVGDCFRCYDRTKKGKDPVTGLLVSAQKAAAPVPPATPPILTGKSAPATPAPDTCMIDVVQLLDDMWAEKRTLMVNQLNQSKNICSRLALANSFAERINSIGA